MYTLYMYLHVKEENLNVSATLLEVLHKTTAQICQHIIIKIVLLLCWWCVGQIVLIILLKIHHKTKNIFMIKYKSIVPGLLGHPNESREFFQTESKAC